MITTETIQQLAEKAAEKIVYGHEFMNMPQVTSIIESVLTESDLYRAGVEAAAALAEQCHRQPCICTTCLIHAEIALKIRRTLLPTGYSVEEDEEKSEFTSE